MHSIDHILAVIDPTVDHQRAMERGVQLARHFEAELELFVCDYHPALADSPFLSHAGQRRGREQFVKKRKSWIEKLAAPLRNEGLDVDTDVVWGKPFYDEVTRKALRSGTNLVLKNTEYHSKIRRTLFTSSDWRLVQECPAPLWFTKLDAIADAPVVVAAVDPMSAHAKAEYLNKDILDVAIALQKYHSAQVHAASWFALPLHARESAKTAAENKNKQRDLMDSLLCAYPTVPRANSHIVMDRDETYLLELVHEIGAQVVIMGAVARGRLDRLALGSTAERMLDELPCDVIIVKPHDFISPLHV